MVLVLSLSENVWLQDFIDFRKNRNKMIRYRKNQILLAFSFWPELKPRDPSNIYELRSYTLKVNFHESYNRNHLERENVTWKKQKLIYEGKSNLVELDTKEKGLFAYSRVDWLYMP